MPNTTIPNQHMSHIDILVWFLSFAIIHVHQSASTTKANNKSILQIIFLAYDRDDLHSSLHRGWAVWYDIHDAERVLKPDAKELEDCLRLYRLCCRRKKPKFVLERKGPQQLKHNVFTLTFLYSFKGLFKFNRCELGATFLNAN